MDRGDIIVALACGVVLFSTIIGMLFFRARGKAVDVEVPETAALEPQIIRTPETDTTVFSSETIEAIHRKYDEMAETDPILAGRLKYAELLAHHGE